MSRWKRFGGFWLKRTLSDEAGNSKQYMLGSVTVDNKKIEFAAHPNANKRKETDPDFILFLRPKE